MTFTDSAQRRRTLSEACRKGWGIALRLGLLAAMSAALSACGGGGSDSSSNNDATVATTTEGSVKGVQAGPVLQYLGIPYAAPPTGPLRWKSPAAPTKYSGTYDASFARSECVQGSATNVSGSEDCLYLNIFRPSPATGPVNAVPVVVWIHGGGYTAGSGMQYNIAPLAASQNVVTVGVNYRLGTFGFLAHPALSAEESPPRSGNYAIQDMQAALKWVRSNIASFGGDPKNVTVFGESAGGNAMYVLLASPASAGLFDKIVPQSGGYYRNQPSLLSAETKGVSVATASFGCIDSNLATGAQVDVAACLRSISPATILGSSVAEPIVDGKVLVETTSSAFQGGRFNMVPVMAGSTHDEGTYFMWAFQDVQGNPVTASNYLTVAAARHLPGPETLARYPLASFTTPSQAMAAAYGDYHMMCGAMQDIDSVAKYVPSTYFYDFADETPASPASFVQNYPPADPLLNYGAYHASDVTYWLGLILPADATAARVGLSTTMMTYLGNFARSSDPNGSGLPAWQKFSSTNRQVLELAYPVNPAYDGYTAHQCEFWYSQPPAELY